MGCAPSLRLKRMHRSGLAIVPTTPLPLNRTPTVCCPAHAPLQLRVYNGLALGPPPLFLGLCPSVPSPSPTASARSFHLRPSSDKLGPQSCVVQVKGSHLLLLYIPWTLFHTAASSSSRGYHHPLGQPCHRASHLLPLEPLIQHK